ncbi:MAG TPA: NUDIX hydrolase [Planctomycetota bacterium]|nr:NUDIX hydrolase [Planctomycetota bacterium]
MAPILDPKFCSRCGAPMTKAIPPGDSKPRHVCTKCAFVHYLDPKVACGTISETDGKIVLIERGIEPRRGFWSFPCGFMEVDETTEQAALRETKEETGLDVELEDHLGTYSYPDNFYGGSIVVVVYRAKILGGTLLADDDCSDAKLVAPKEIPWDQLAFKSSVSAVQDWLRFKGISR